MRTVVRRTERVREYEDAETAVDSRFTPSALPR